MKFKQVLDEIRTVRRNQGGKIVTTNVASKGKYLDKDGRERKRTDAEKLKMKKKKKLRDRTGKADRERKAKISQRKHDRIKTPNN